MENYFMDYDKVTGKILGYYIRSVHKDNIPSGCIEITPEKHEEYMASFGTLKLNVITLQDEVCEQEVEVFALEETAEQLEIKALKQENMEINDTINYIMKYY